MTKEQAARLAKIRADHADGQPEMSAADECRIPLYEDLAFLLVLVDELEKESAVLALIKKKNDQDMWGET